MTRGKKWWKGGRTEWNSPK